MQSEDPRPTDGARFVTYEERMSDDGLARFKERMGQIRARRAVVRRVWYQPVAER